MIRRPLNEKFSPAVRAGRKVTTMREKAWPVGVPILLYNWSGKPYRSKQVEVAVVVVKFVSEALICRMPGCGSMMFDWDSRGANVEGRRLWQCEGFDSEDEMNEWFMKLVKPGQTLSRQLMWFEMVEERGAA
jgi:hypothetical protein